MGAIILAIMHPFYSSSWNEWDDYFKGAVSLVITNFKLYIPTFALSLWKTVILLATLSNVIKLESKLDPSTFMSSYLIKQYDGVSKGN